MTTIPELVTAQDYEGLVKFCENFELTAVTESNNTPITEVYPVYLAAYILTNDLQSAHHLRKRILKNNQKTPEIDAIWQVCQSLIQQNYPQVYPSLDGYPWSQWMQPLVQHIVEKTRDYVLEMMATVYTSIQLAQASTLFGLPEQEVVDVLVGRGWKLNEGVLYPVKPVPTRLASDNQFERLADVVFNLEKF
ncbi:hypothetical protein K501DRAFT_231989 [Backusella circina FSU 941]|nr:hypothetical protein K501DRAFT_231989 [Backusella circina FSU 941]